MDLSETDFDRYLAAKSAALKMQDAKDAKDGVVLSEKEVAALIDEIPALREFIFRVSF